jgi:hypothetical protein
MTVRIFNLPGFNALLRAVLRATAWARLSWLQPLWSQQLFCVCKPMARAGYLVRPPVSRVKIHHRQPEAIEAADELVELQRLADIVEGLPWSKREAVPGRAN